MTRIEGGCHCGLVRFEATVPDGPVEILECNCSICAMTGYLHLNVADADFRLIEGRGDLTTYRFGTGAAKHMFCAQCGVKSFYKPRSHPNHVSVNVRCLDEGHGLDMRIVPFDGRDHPGTIG